MKAKQLSGSKVILVVMDGFGISRDKTNNAIHLANTPNLDELFANYPHTLLAASGRAVGLPEGQIGNSEVGHTAMGCGCTPAQDIMRINQAIDDESFFENPAFVKTIKQASQNGRPVYLVGLVSDGGVHSHICHLEALIKMCQHQGAKPVLHMITDGRDTAPQEAIYFEERIRPLLKQAGGYIATISGRYYAMDRDNRWDRTERAWRAIALSEGKTRPDCYTAIREAYREEVGDEFIEPVVINGAEPLTSNDRMILFNFRNDRPRQLIRALTSPDFNEFKRGSAPVIHITTMTEVHTELSCPIAFAPMRPKINLAKIISDKGLKQFHCAETEKYPHVTFYFNGGIESPLPGEDRKLIPSPQVSTYDLQPEMSAKEVTDAVIQALRNPEYVFVLVNFANTDMVGHTAVPAPIIKAVETVDDCVGRVVKAAQENQWSTLITADHGNCDEMRDPQTQLPNTKHTLNPVPCLIVGHEDYALAQGCSISSVAPTILELMGLEIPPEMDARSVIEPPSESESESE